MRPKLPGQTTDERKYPSMEVFEYVYVHFYENNCHKFLIDIQPWIAFIKEQNLKNPSLPVLDWQGTLFNDILEWTVDVKNNLPANSLKLAKIQADKAQRTVKGTPVT